ncbi:alpha/beta hydrolase [Caenimonas aquaedulcis]|uniref:Alpha/beta hydrolase n=1 Tax=Caenimonas aquaedulcis TaxID=2793270 RepID=A0A931H710_9BURK|nr:alpha/beta hydrolase [Caenimonas aquaedulcis]MBG9389859.1 alpha/beta hydrolase [Caenimonas aquaedulcis]
MEKDTTLDTPGRAPMQARIYGRKRAGTGSPVVLHFHGGAFVSGDLDSGACMARLLEEAGAVVVSVAYPLAPEHRFPDAVEAGYAALEWIYKQRTKLGGAGARVHLAGDEAGGNLAAAVAMVARDRGHPPLAGQILVAPMLDPCVGTASLRETMACGTACKWADGWQQYLRKPNDAEHPYAVPAHATRLAGLPPALVLSAADDPMRDEAVAYAQRLQAAGIAVTSGMIPQETGWPDALADSCSQRPCQAAVLGHLRTFLNAATPPPH